MNTIVHKEHIGKTGTEKKRDHYKPFKQKKDRDHPIISANKPTDHKKISELKPGDFFDGIVKITRKAKPGPVIFNVTDIYGTIDAVTKDSDFDVDDIVQLEGPVSERAGRLQIEILQMRKAVKDFSKVIDEVSLPKRTTFSIPSARFEKMKPRFIELATKIRRAIVSNQPIIIRHHNDSDGIGAGLCLEESIEGFMKRIGINPEYNLYRSPSKAPFYETTDVFRDLTMSKRLTETHGQQKPLIIVTDNGSTPEDQLGFQMLQLTGHEAIVIDHHNPVIIKDGKTTVCSYLIAHLNPYLFGLDSQTCAGMLCYELGRMIDEEFDNVIIPAVAAISDRSEIPERDAYIQKTGKNIEDLKKIGVAVDFTSYHMKFDAGHGLFEELYTNQPLVQLINTEVTAGVETQLQSTMPYLRTQDINGITFSYIDLEKYTLRFTYPTPGKVLGMIHDTVAEGKEHLPVLTLGLVSDMIIVRATKPILPVQRIIEIVKKRLPEANVDGGGHEMAGTIKFVQAHRDAIVEIIKEELKKIDTARFIAEEEK